MTTIPKCADCDHSKPAEDTISYRIPGKDPVELRGKPDEGNLQCWNPRFVNIERGAYHLGEDDYESPTPCEKARAKHVDVHNATNNCAITGCGKAAKYFKAKAVTLGEARALDERARQLGGRLTRRAKT